MTSQDTIAVSLDPPRGFHPSVKVFLSLPTGLRHGHPPTMGMILDPETRKQTAPSRPACELYLSQTLPSDMFADPYELELRSTEYEATVYGERNLELPVHEMSGEGQLVLLRVPLSADVRNTTIDLPLHLRYGMPRKIFKGDSGIQTVEVPWPEAFWACPSNGTPIPHPHRRQPLTTQGNRYTKKSSANRFFSSHLYSQLLQHIFPLQNRPVSRSRSHTLYRPPSRKS
jgi:hypothetical protein